MLQHLYYSNPQVVIQEVPNEISLALSISGCKLNCKNCHSPETHNPFYGKPLTQEELTNLIKQHPHITAVLLYGGEWNPQALYTILTIIKSYNLATALYTGREPHQLPINILPLLDYLKVGIYIESLGGLQSPTTNQRFIDPIAYYKTQQEVILFEGLFYDNPLTR